MSLLKVRVCLGLVILMAIVTLGLIGHQSLWAIDCVLAIIVLAALPLAWDIRPKEYELKENEMSDIKPKRYEPKENEMSKEALWGLWSK